MASFCPLPFPSHPSRNRNASVNRLNRPTNASVGGHPRSSSTLSSSAALFSPPPSSPSFKSSSPPPFGLDFFGGLIPLFGKPANILLKERLGSSRIASKFPYPYFQTPPIRSVSDCVFHHTVGNRPLIVGLPCKVSASPYRSIASLHCHNCIKRAPNF